MIIRLKKLLGTNTSTKQTVAKNTFWLAFSTVTSRVVRAGLIIYAARMLGVEGYGVFSYAISLVALFGVFSDIGLTGLLTREASKKTENFSAYISTTFVLKLVFVLGTALAVIFFGSLVSTVPQANPILAIVAILVAFDSLRGFCFSITRAQNRMEIEAGLDLATELFITLLGFLALTFYSTTIALSVAYMIGSGIGFFLILISLRKNFTNIFTHFDKSLVGTILQAAWPFALIGLLSGLMTSIDAVIIGHFLPPYDLGLYAAAQRPISILYLIPGFLNTSLLPIMANLLHAKETARVGTILEKAFALSNAFALPVVAGGIIIGGPVIVLLLGSDYAGSTLTFKLLLLTLPLTGLGMIISSALFSLNRQRAFVVASALGAITNIVLDIILIPKYGIAGSAVATLIALVVMNGYNLYRLKKDIPFRSSARSWKIIFSTLVMTTIAYGLFQLHIHSPYIIGISALVYIGLLFLLKDQTITDIKEILQGR